MRKTNKFIIIAFGLLVVNSKLSAIPQDPEPLNSHFAIGREPVTSPGYRVINTDFIFTAFEQESDIVMENTFAYGFAKRAGFLFIVPIFFKQSGERRVSRGLADIGLHFQWHFYRAEYNLALIQMGMTFPTGKGGESLGGGLSSPALGTGSFNPFIQFSAIHASDNMYAAFIVSDLITTRHKNKHAGNVFDFDFSIGPKFKIGQHKKTELFVLAELESFIFFQDRFKGKKIRDTGRFLIGIGPSIVFNTKYGTFTGRVLLPYGQRIFGIQEKGLYRGNFNYAYSF